MKNTIVNCLVTILCTTVTVACNKVIDVRPENELSVDVIFEDDQMAISAVVGLENRFSGTVSPFNGQFSRYLGLAAGELSVLSNNADDKRFFSLSWKTNDLIVSGFWNNCYSYIYHCNSVLKNLDRSKSLSPGIKNALVGETRFLRALVYFYVVNLYDSVPLVLDTDTEITKKIKRVAPAVIYKQIVEDLKKAEELLPYEYPLNNIAPSPRIRPNKAAATALMARVFLYLKDYANAEAKSSWVIDSELYDLEVDPGEVFLAKDNRETIYALYPTMDGYNTVEGRIFGINPNSSNAFFALPKELIDVFESSDLRVAQWMQTYSGGSSSYKIPYKYKVYLAEDRNIIEYNIVLRLAECYLIRAEARARQGKLTQAIADVNIIRERAKATMLPLGTTESQLITAIETESQREFFAEFGHRWFDLRRLESRSTPGLTRADDVLGFSKSQYWAGYKINLPIPADEITKAAQLTQNPGY